MSATGRSNVRHADDFYSTPSWCTRAILVRLGMCDFVLDPCCGSGAILDVVSNVWGRRDGVWNTFGIDINRERVDKVNGHACRCADYLNIPPYDGSGWGGDRPRLIITNPPYKLALPFIEKSLRSVAPGGDVAMLLRINFLGSQKRASFWRQHPCAVYVLPKRPSFTNGGTDATEYAWFVWGEGRENTWDILDL